MSLVISKVFTYDTDAGNYIQAVEGPAGDNQALEPAVRQAINNFVVGCKQDGIWSAIKASCILAGARTLNGALVPLAGTAPTNYNFVAGDYNRKAGLKSDGTKYLDTNAKPSGSPPTNAHFSTYTTSTSSIIPGDYIGASATTPFNSFSQIIDNDGTLNVTINTTVGVLAAAGTGNNSTGFFGVARSTAATLNYRFATRTTNANSNSVTPNSLNYFVFCRNINGSPTRISDRAHAFYSIGESLDLAKLDSRVTDLINAFGAAIP